METVCIRIASNLPRSEVIIKLIIKASRAPTPFAEIANSSTQLSPPVTRNQQFHFNSLASHDYLYRNPRRIHVPVQLEAQSEQEIETAVDAGDFSAKMVARRE